MKWISTRCLLANASQMGITAIKVDDLCKITNILNAKFRSLGHDVIIEPDLEYALGIYPDLFRHYKGEVYMTRVLSYEYVNTVFNGGLDAHLVELIREEIR